MDNFDVDVECDLLGAAIFPAEEIRRQNVQAYAYDIVEILLDALKGSYLLGCRSSARVVEEAYKIIYSPANPEKRKWLLNADGLQNFELSVKTKNRLFGEFVAFINENNVKQEKGRPRLKGTPLGDLIQKMVLRINEVDGLPIVRETKSGDTVYMRVSEFFIACGFPCVSPSTVEELYCCPHGRKNERY